MAERFNPDDWIRFTAAERTLLRDALQYRMTHDRKLDHDGQMALVRLPNNLADPDPVVRDIRPE